MIGEKAIKIIPRTYWELELLASHNYYNWFQQLIFFCIVNNFETILVLFLHLTIAKMTSIRELLNVSDSCI